MSSTNFSTNLFICATPLQSLIASAIIDLKGIGKEQCMVFFYSTVRDRKIETYYEGLKVKCRQAYFYQCNRSFPVRMYDARSFFSSIDYDDIYIASVNSIYVQLALSLNKHKRVFTFDDGTANITPSSRYNNRYGMSIRKNLASRIFGNRYTIEKIKNESLEHYTIYPGFKNNLSDSPTAVSVFVNGNGKRTIGKGLCSVILGTVYQEAFGANMAELVVKKLNAFANTLGDNTIYIPHPREQHHTIINRHILKSDKIAEEVIADLFKKYAKIDLYGFCSTAQINMASVSGLRNCFFTVSGERQSSIEMRAIARNMGITDMVTVDLDKY